MVEELARCGGRATPGELGRLVGVGKSAQAAHIKDLAAAGLVDATNREVRITPRGLEHAPIPTVLVGGGPRLHAAMAAFPPASGALLRLMAGATVARHHLGARTEGALWPGFSASGGPGTGKSALGRAACWAFGLDWTRHSVDLGQLTVGALVGRRLQGSDGWRLDPSPYLAGPFLVLDEFAEADPDVRKAAEGLYLQGAVRVFWEGVDVIVSPTTFVAYNPPPGGRDVLARRLERRSVRINLGTTRPPGLDAALEGLFASDPGPPIRIGGLELPAERLSDDMRAALRTVKNALNDAGRAQFEARLLEPCVLGWAALCGVAPGESLTAPTVQVVLDYLSCAETLGLTLPDWRARLAGMVDTVRAEPDAPALATLEASLKAGEDAAAARQADRERTRRARDVEDLGLVRARAELVAGLIAAETAIRQVPPAHRTRAAGLRAALRRLRDRAGDAKISASLADVRAMAAEPLSEARRLRQEIDTERAESERAERIRQEQERRRKQHEAAAARSAKHQADRTKANAARALAPVRALAVKLERLYLRDSASRGETPLETLRALRLPNGRAVCEYVPGSARGNGGAPKGIRGALEVVGALAAAAFASEPSARASGWLRSTLDPNVAVRASQLERWGPGSRSLLAPALRALHAEEGRLERAARKNPRPGRLVLEAAAPSAPPRTAPRPVGPAPHPSGRAEPGATLSAEEFYRASAGR